MISFHGLNRFYLYRKPCDMRKSFDGLCGIVRRELKLDLLQGDVFIFINRRGDMIKLLMWDRTGFAIWYKRLEEGTFEIPRKVSESDHIEIDQQALLLILEGIELGSVRHRKRYIRV